MNREISITEFRNEGCAFARMFPQNRFSYLRSALSHAQLLTEIRNGRPASAWDIAHYQRVRNLSVALYREDRAILA